MPPAAKKTEKKEKVFHPKSRKAGQIERASLRKSKLEQNAKLRSQKKSGQVDRHVFFYHATPEDIESLTLVELHGIVRDVWLTRHDIELAEERATRRKGRPKSAKEHTMEELQLQEQEEYRTGIVVPDLTDPLTVKLFRKWQANDPAYLHILRFIRISGDAPDAIAVEKHGSVDAGYPSPVLVEPEVTSTMDTS